MESGFEHRECACGEEDEERGAPPHHEPSFLSPHLGIHFQDSRESLGFI